MERWRQPIAMLQVEEDPDSADQIGGRWYRGVAYTTDADGWERIRTGYVCVMCAEPHEQPYPEHCGICGYEMRKYQAKNLEVEFEGTVDLGPSTTLKYEQDRLDEVHERRLWTPGSSVSVPKEG